MITPIKDLRKTIIERNKYIPTPKAKRKTLNMGAGVTRTVAKPGDIVIGQLVKPMDKSA